MMNAEDIRQRWLQDKPTFDAFGKLLKVRLEGKH